jgi:DNA-binding XRE family transcriptional regulator
MVVCLAKVGQIDDPVHMAATIAEAVRFELRIHRDLPPPAERRRLREEAGMSQQKLAEIIGVTRQAICQYESGKRAKPRNPLVRQRYVEALRALREGI